ncbi:hypothetical protein L7F22_048922 [Adiantum nelumboides]|nr:hypothetical protein [Adiantum nelumboides]
MLLGQIVKKEESACSLLQKDSAKKKKKERIPPHLNSPSALHKPSLGCIYEESGDNSEEEALISDDDDGREHGNNTNSNCGLSLVGLLSLICPFR